jgi:hypothetical protein
VWSELDSFKGKKEKSNCDTIVPRNLSLSLLHSRFKLHKEEEVQASTLHLCSADLTHLNGSVTHEQEGHV